MGKSYTEKRQKKAKYLISLLMYKKRCCNLFFDKSFSKVIGLKSPLIKGGTATQAILV